MTNEHNQALSEEQEDELLQTLKSRFEKHMHRHQGINWANVEAKLIGQPHKWISLYAMESTGGEPDVVDFDEATNAFMFFDCSTETPKGRRSVCYDREGLESRKKYKPENNAIDMAKEMGIELLTEEQYRRLQQLGTFDMKTSSWIHTPTHIRELGGALFCDYRYGQVFVYHNGASSYYAVRGFRGCLQV